MPWKRCSCGRTFTRAEWLALPGKPRQLIPGGSDLELRDCPDCCSTLACAICCDCGTPVGPDEERLCCCEATAAHLSCRISCPSCCCGAVGPTGSGPGMVAP